MCGIEWNVAKFCVESVHVLQYEATLLNLVKGTRIDSKFTL